MSKHTELSISRAAAYKLLGIQLVISVGIALLLMLYTGVDIALSALIGGLIYILPNAYFVRFAFRESGRQTAGNILRWFYVGEAGKLVLAGVFFALSFALVKSLHAVVLFTVFIVMIFVNLAGLTLFRITRQENSK